MDKDTFEGGSEVLQKFEGRVACNWEWGGGGGGGGGGSGRFRILEGA